MLPKNWTIEPLGSLTENLDVLRMPVKGSDRAPGPYPYYGASGVVDSVDKFIFDGEYLLIAEDGENLRSLKTPFAFLARGKFWVNNHAHIVRGNNRANTRFLLYALLNSDVSGYLTGSTMPKLTQGNMNRIPVITPPLSEQLAIADVLGALDDKIELNHRTNETLEALARALFQSWFVDFDPVRAKAEGRQPAGMDAATAALFPERFEDSALGEVPQGWDIGQLSEIAELTKETVNPLQAPTVMFDHYSIPAFDEGRIPTRELGSAIKSNKFVVPNGAVLLSKLNPNTPRVWLPAPATQYPPISSTEFLPFLPTEPGSREYLYGLFTSGAFVTTLASMVTGTSGSHQRVKPEHLLNLDVVKPPISIVEAFTQITQPLHAKIAANRQEGQTLAELRDTLLPKLMSGEVRVA